MKKNNMNAFTLIELLAVIVILAIIALIATPIVLGIINDTKENAVLRSADNYLGAVEQAIMKKNMESGGSFNPSICTVVLNETLNCDGEELKLEIDGETPSVGKIVFKDGNITNVNLTYEDKEIIIGENGSTVFLEREYEIGQEVTFNPGDMDRIWNVIDEDDTTVTLLLNQNLGDTVAWLSEERILEYEPNAYDLEIPMNNYGPETALTYLNTLTKDWTVSNIESYKYVNNKKGVAKPFGYREVEIENGITTITQFNSNKVTIEGETKARLLTSGEIFEIAQKTNTNLTENNLRAYIERNLSTVNTGLGTSFTTVDEVIDLNTNGGTAEWLQYESKYFQTYSTVWGMINNYGIEAAYDIILPEYIYQNLYSDHAPYSYWTYSSSNAEASHSSSMGNTGLRTDYHVDSYSYVGLRPVITILKSELS